MKTIYEVNVAGPDDIFYFETELKALQEINNFHLGYLAWREATEGDSDYIPFTLATVKPIEVEEDKDIEFSEYIEL